MDHMRKLNEGVEVVGKLKGKRRALGLRARGWAARGAAPRQVRLGRGYGWSGTPPREKGQV